MIEICLVQHHDAGRFLHHPVDMFMISRIVSHVIQRHVEFLTPQAKGRHVTNRELTCEGIVQGQSRIDEKGDIGVPAQVRQQLGAVVGDAGSGGRQGAEVGDTHGVSGQ